MKFHNRPNELVKTADGRSLWISRSVAVAVCVILVKKKEAFVLVNQRGPGVPDYSGYWNMPCGYLDFDETAGEASIREVWEECGVDVPSLLPLSKVSYFDEPWSVASGTSNPKQNVTLHHGLLAYVDTLPALSPEHNEPNETSDIRWLPLSELHSLEFAFNHVSRIEQFVKHVHSVAGIEL